MGLGHWVAPHVVVDRNGRTGVAAQVALHWHLGWVLQHFGAMMV
jgi:hypothetical protein